MAKKCNVCGQEVEGNFCQNCGNKVTEESGAVSKELTDFMAQKLENKKNHSVYKVTVGIIMTIIGALVLIGGLAEDSDVIFGELLDYNVTLAFVIPGIATIIGGVTHIVSKYVKPMLPVSGTLYLVAAVVNMVGIENISILAILGIVFGILNLVYFFSGNK